ncbi:AbrB/MazE/SpoVT family DNA-binding domain-containing protein [Elstera cyanobacteriorum]|uniref:AbrB/MazE/SpoVT family DNA-binding domain-containing protein n=1 Tax=Elstera cyanobacteriorum TaxID=2022747 RepID=UPI0023578B6F|nr:AbrB/MazE/SpoVT family DNA-binding domain-containing protein [Elstera cyanobacteriorum]MCK6444378.1 AbrB/MazE/SpoVT family DNA-binding domain-containing protein [Elstera cyanobacteriorum]
MRVELTVTGKGQVTLKKAILDHLGVKPGDRLNIILKPDGRVELKGGGPRRSLGSLYGALSREGVEPVSLEAMQAAIEDMATR